MPLRYVINLILIVAVWFVLNSLIQSGVITNYWSGILITVGISYKRSSTAYFLP